MAIGRSLRPAFSQTRLDLTGSIAPAAVAAMVGCMLDHE
ncbi:hypothetical protein SLEP1_g38463 [Rubroshorea leprosula]|nr:hypothetical protein SLEP1_g38463 [Rubroshorea leprosula]